MQRRNNLAWITGAGGLIGNYLVQLAPKFAPQWKLRALKRGELDLLDFEAVRREFQKDQPQLIIHCAAVTSVADAEAKPELARQLNIEVTRLLAELAAEGQFAFLSTDVLFDGRKGNYAETDAPNPLHLYGETKAIAEQIILKNPCHLVVRTSINAGISPTHDRGFNERTKVEWRSGRMMKLFTDEFRNPIFAGETARALWELANQDRSGIYHVAGAEKLSRWQIGQLLVKRWPELNAQIEPASSKDYPGPRRAPDTTLDIGKVQKVLSHPLPGLTAWLAANPSEPI